VEHGLVTPLELDAAAAPWIRAFIEKYRDLGAQLADASLCYLSERERVDTVFTLDRRDFSVYRTRGRQSLVLLPESI
jgi:predicted nucleic acid-binding protein